MLRTLATLSIGFAAGVYARERNVVSFAELESRARASAAAAAASAPALHAALDAFAKQPPPSK